MTSFELGYQMTKQAIEDGIRRHTGLSKAVRMTDDEGKDKATQALKSNAPLYAHTPPNRLGRSPYIRTKE